MGLDLIYICKNHQHIIRFSSAEWDIIEQIRANLPESVEVLFNVSELGEGTTVELALLKKAVEAISDLLSEQPAFLPYIYQFKPEYVLVGPPEDDNRFYRHRFDTGGLSGIKLFDDEKHRYMVDAGLDKLKLSKAVIEPDDRGFIIEEVDIRQLNELQTENCGLIQFRKRRADTEFRERLIEIDKFLASVEGFEVVKIIT